MNELNFDNFENTDNTESEIDRIQREINKDLQTASEPEPEVQIIYREDVPLETPAQALETPPAESAAQAAAPANPAPPAYAAPKPIAEDSVYMETIKREKTKNGRRQWLKTIVAACIVGLIGGPLAGLAIGFGQEMAAKYLGTRPAETPSAQFSFDTGEITTIAVAPNASSIIDDFSAIVDVVEPSVVGITSISSTGSGSSFFGSGRQTPSSQGSGIIFDEDDTYVYIATNYHVVTGADQVGISVQGADPVSATPVGAEEAADIAVISVLKTDLADVGIEKVVLAKFGSSDEMKVGEIVLAIGNALGEGNTATLGIVSAKSKEIFVEGLALTVIQTDAAINPGNSGGPLVNSKGEVVAINTAKFQYYDVEGTGYSIPVSEVKPIIERLRNKTPKPFLGVRMESVDEEIAEMYNLPALGVLIREVIDGSAAQKAGILRNDVITGFDGKPVLSAEDLTDYILEHNVGDIIEVKLYRQNEGAVTLNVTLGEMPVSSTF